MLQPPADSDWPGNPAAAQPQQRPLRSRALLILWPAFVFAGVLEALVFAVVDPGSLHGFGADAITSSRTAVYSVTFLIFWSVLATAGAVTVWLTEPDT
jgi:fatty acid desaturase